MVGGVEDRLAKKAVERMDGPALVFGKGWREVGERVTEGSEEDTVYAGNAYKRSPGILLAALHVGGGA